MSRISLFGNVKPQRYFEQKSDFMGEYLRTCARIDENREGLRRS